MTKPIDNSKLVFDVYFPGDYSAGMLPFSDTVTIQCESGNFGGEDEGEYSFKAAFLDFLREWYDGAGVAEHREFDPDAL